MKPVRITANNFKGMTFTHALAPMNLIVGDNAAGKSARVEAVRVAMVGYDLRLGKRTCDTFNLFSGSGGSVMLTFDNDQTNYLELAQDAKGKLQGKIGLPVTFPTVSLDAAEYFGLTGPQRIKYLFERSGAKEFDAAEIIAKIKSIKIEGMTGVHQTAVQTLADEFDDLNELRKGMKQDLPTFFAAVLTSWEKKLSDGAAVAKQMKGAVEAATTLRSAEGVKPVRAGLDVLISQKQKELSDQSAKVGKIKESLSREQSDQYRAKQVLKDQAIGLRQSNEHKKALESAVKSWADQIETFKKDYAEECKSSVCPTCGEASKGWKRKLKQDYADRIKTAETNLIMARRNLDGFVPYKPSSFIPYCSPFTNGQLAEAEETVAKLQAELTTLQQEQKSAIAAKADQRRRQEALDALSAKEAEVVVLRAAIKVMRAEQERLITQNVGKVMEQASRFTKAVFGWSVEFKDGEIGRYLNVGGWVGHSTFSGLEQLLTYCGICLAFAQDAPSKIVIMDELGRLHARNKPKLLAAMQKAISDGLVDCFIGIDTDAEDWPQPAKLNFIVV